MELGGGARLEDTGPYVSFCFISISLSNLRNIVEALHVWYVLSYVEGKGWGGVGGLIKLLMK